MLHWEIPPPSPIHTMMRNLWGRISGSVTDETQLPLMMTLMTMVMIMIVMGINLYETLPSILYH